MFGGFPSELIGFFLFILGLSGSVFFIFHIIWFFENKDLRKISKDIEFLERQIEITKLTNHLNDIKRESEEK